MGNSNLNLNFNKIKKKVIDEKVENFYNNLTLKSLTSSIEKFIVEKDLIILNDSKYSRLYKLYLREIFPNYSDKIIISDYNYDFWRKIGYNIYKIDLTDNNIKKYFLKF